MAQRIVGVRFRDAGKIYYYNPGNLDLKLDDEVIAEVASGLDFGKVVFEPREISDDEINEEVFSIIRIATEEDKKHDQYLKDLAKQAKEVFIDCVARRGLDMKLIETVYTFDEKKVIFYFTSDGRVDFRDLVRDLASHFKARIELRQIGVRDEARKFGGIGLCGRPCCCSSWLNDFVPVSIKMAKEQNLSLNSTKISGICGRLLCCLTYEEAYYEELSKRMPQIGQRLKTPEGMGQVYKLRTLEEAVLVKIKNDRDETEIKRFSLEELDEAAKLPLAVLEKRREQQHRSSVVDASLIEKSRQETESLKEEKKRQKRRPQKKAAPQKRAKKAPDFKAIKAKKKFNKNSSKTTTTTDKPKKKRPSKLKRRPRTRNTRKKPNRAQAKKN